jgi:hypothetical protein
MCDQRIGESGSTFISNFFLSSAHPSANGARPGY